MLGLTRARRGDYPSSIRKAFEGSTFQREALKPVTNQATTTPGSGRRCATYTDMGVTLTCSGPTQRDGIRRNWHAW